MSGLIKIYTTARRFSCEGGDIHLTLGIWVGDASTLGTMKLLTVLDPQSKSNIQSQMDHFPAC